MHSVLHITSFSGWILNHGQKYFTESWNFSLGKLGQSMERHWLIPGVSVEIRNKINGLIDVEHVGHGFRGKEMRDWFRNHILIKELYPRLLKRSASDSPTCWPRIPYYMARNVIAVNRIKQKFKHGATRWHFTTQLIFKSYLLQPPSM